jgi:hypothetical protein
MSASEDPVESHPIVKYIIVGLLIMIVGALATAFKALFRGPRNSTAGVKALTLRVGLSIGLFVLLMVLYALGVIQPRGMH